MIRRVGSRNGDCCGICCHGHGHGIGDEVNILGNRKPETQLGFEGGDGIRSSEFLLVVFNQITVTVNVTV
jgi:hypothetical protein